MTKSAPSDMGFRAAQGGKAQRSEGALDLSDVQAAPGNVGGKFPDDRKKALVRRIQTPAVDDLILFDKILPAEIQEFFPKLVQGVWGIVVNLHRSGQWDEGSRKIRRG